MKLLSVWRAETQADMVSVVTVGLSLGIPLALAASLFVPNANVDAITYTTLLGALLVILGFCILGWRGWEESRSKAVEESGTTREDGALSDRLTEEI